MNYTTSHVNSVTNSIVGNYTTAISTAISTTITEIPKSDSFANLFLYIGVGFLAFIIMFICFIVYVQRRTYRMRHGYLLLLSENLKADTQNDRKTLLDSTDLEEIIVDKRDTNTLIPYEVPEPPDDFENN